MCSGARAYAGNRLTHLRLNNKRDNLFNANEAKCHSAPCLALDQVVAGYCDRFHKFLPIIGVSEDNIRSIRVSLLRSPKCPRMTMLRLSIDAHSFLRFKRSY